MHSSDYLVAFSGNTQNYCVGLVDMVNSTKIAATIGNGKISTYYQIFLNSMSRILSRFGGFVIKNVGDCLVYYFPESLKSNRKYGFMSCLECSLAMIEYHDTICKRLDKEKLPYVDYRISADYGSVVLMKSNNSTAVDMIGPPVNMCSKINHAATKNNIAIQFNKTKIGSIGEVVIFSNDTNLPANSFMRNKNPASDLIKPITAKGKI